MYVDCGITKILIYVQLKQYITESICLTKLTLDNMDTNPKQKLVIGLGSHKKSVITCKLYMKLYDY